MREAGARDKHQPELVLSQVVSNAVNARASVLAYTSFHHFRLLAAGCSNTLVLFTHRFALLQVVDELPGPITAIAWSKSGQLACACGSEIFLYKPQSIPRGTNSAECPYTWSRQDVLVQSSPHILSLSFAEDNLLLSGGSDLCLWTRSTPRQAVSVPEPDVDATGGGASDSSTPSDGEEPPATPSAPVDEPLVTSEEEWSMSWSTTAPTPVSWVSFSPDRRLFATCGKFDRMVKVWHHTSEGSGYTFIYLPHPRSLTGMEWRSVVKGPTGFTPNVLLTTSRDGVVRLWSETSQNDTLHFYVISVLDPVLPSAGCAVSWLTRDEAVPSVSAPGESPSSPTQTSGSLSLSVGSPIPNTLGAHGHTNRGRTLGATLCDETDWLLGIEPDGSVYIWAVRGLYDEPRGTPRVTLWAVDRVPTAGMGHPLLRSLASASFEEGGGVDTRGNVPDIISLMTLSVSGHLATFAFQVTDDTQPPTANSPVARGVNVLTGAKLGVLNKEVFAGHRELVSTLSSHTKQPFVASASQDGQVLLHRLASSTLCDTPLAVRHAANLSGSYTHVAWATSEPILVCASDKVISVHRVRSTPLGEELPLLGELENSADACPLTHLFVVEMNSGICVVGVPRDSATLLLWKVVIDKRTITSTRLPVTVLDNPIVCAAVVPSPSTGLSASPYHLISCDSSSQLTLWQIGVNTDGETQIQSLATLPLDLPDEQVVGIASPYFGRFSTASVTSSGYRFRIWEFESSLPGLCLEHTMTTISGTQEPLMAWHEIVPGTFVLAVAHPSQLTVFGPKRTSLSDVNSLKSGGDVKWIKHSHIELYQPVPVSGLTWTANGELLFALGSQICVYTKWMRGCLHSHTLSEHVLQALRCAPDYHPQVLVSLAMKNRLDLVDLILKSLLEQVRDKVNQSECEQNLHVRSLALRLTDLLGEDYTLSPESPANVTSDAAPAVVDDDPWGRRDASAFDSNAGASDDLWGRTDPNKYSSLIDQAPTTSTPSFQTSTLVSSDLSDAVVQELTDALSTVTLPHLTSQEQAFLLAVVSAVSSIKGMQRSLDESGLRFLLAAKLSQFLKRTVPLKQRSQHGLSSADMLWGLHSESQDLLCDHVLPGTTLTWDQIKEAGVPYWLKSRTKLASIAEKLAKSQFTADKEPLDAMLIYLALGKKTTVVALFKAVKNTRLVDFLSNDFTDPRWITAALKNAYALMSKQQFSRAAAFFLLAGKVSDCVNLLNRNLRDEALAIFVARLSDPPGLTSSELVVSLWKDQLASANAVGDMFKASCFQWHLQNYSEALEAVVRSRPHGTDEDAAAHCADDCHQHGELFYLPASAAFRATLPLVSVARHLSRLPQLSQLHGALEVEERMFFPTLYMHERTGNYAWGLELLMSPSAATTPCATGDSANPAGMQMRDALIENARYRYSVRLLVQQIELIERRRSVDSAERDYEHLQDDFKWIVGTLGLDRYRIGHALVRYCESQGYLYSGCVVQQYLESDVKSSVPEQPALLKEILANAREVNQLLENMPVHHLTVRQATGLARTAVDLRKSLHLLRESVAAMQVLTPLILAEIVVAIHIASFLAAWTLEQYGTLHACLVHPPGSSPAEGMRSNTKEGQGIQFSLDQALVGIDAVIAARSADEAKARVCHDSDDDDHDHDVHHHHSHYDHDSSGHDDSDDDHDHHDHHAYHTAAKVEIYPGGTDDPKVLYKLTLRKFFANIEQYIDTVCGCKLLALRSNAHSELANVIRSLGIWTLSLSHHGSAASEVQENASKDSTLMTHSSLKDWITAQSSRAADDLRLDDCCIDESARGDLWTYFAQKDGVSTYLDVNGSAMEDFYRPNVPVTMSNLSTLSLSDRFTDPVEVFKHKDLITSISINSANPSMLALATKKGVQEIKIPISGKAHAPASLSSLADPVSIPSLESTSRFVDWVGDDRAAALVGPSFNGYLSQFALTPSSRATRDQGVHALGNHPELPVYIAGGYNGSVNLWQFEQDDCLVEYATSVSAKIHRVRFNAYGNKFGVCDNQGHLQLYQFESNAESLHPYEDFVAHSKTARDLAFLTSGSFIATVGNSVGNRNLCLWDTLLPPHKAMVESVVCHEAGADCVAFASRRLLLLTAGKKGEVSVYDLRQRSVITTLQAHSLAVKSIRVNPTEEYFVTGSTDGDVKVWDLVTFKLVDTWHGLHEKRTFFLGSGGGSGAVSHYGVRDVIFSGRDIYTAGADGRILRVSPR